MASEWEGVPKSLRCPISKQLMKDPVILISDCQTYDKQHLVHWLKEIGNVSPVTLQSVASSQFIPNLAIKQQIEEYSTIQRQYDKLKFSRSFSSLSPSHSAASCVRLLLIGDCGVGKTSIKKYIEFDRMTIDPSYVRPTIGIESAFVQFEQKGTLRTFKHIKEEEDPIIVKITDICGQDKFRSVARQCYRGIHGVVMVCSVDNRESVKNLKKKWTDDIFEHAPDSIYGIVVVNKCDLLQVCQDTVQLHRYEEVMRSAIQFAHSMGYPIYSTSAVTGEYIHAAFAEITRRIVQDTMMWDMIRHSPKRRSNTKVSVPLEATQMNTGNGCLWALIGVGNCANRAYDSIKQTLE